MQLDFQLIYELMQEGIRKEHKTAKQKMKEGDPALADAALAKANYGDGILQLFRMTSLRLMTCRKAAFLTGSSSTFFRQLLKQKKLTRYEVNSSVYISLTEFEALASAKNQEIPPRSKAYYEYKGYEQPGK
ncbi:MAG TPA: hypothetical protein VK658_15015 [Chryseolinea sp.]|nr:hypothetical protein [Chryseolinea sp.]